MKVKVILNDLLQFRIIWRAILLKYASGAVQWLKNTNYDID